MQKPSSRTLSPLLPGLEGYEGKLVHLLEDCKARGVSFSGIVLKALSSCLGPSSARAVVFHVGPDCLSDPERRVAELGRVFGEGAAVILREVLSTERGGSNALEESLAWRA